MMGEWMVLPCASQHELRLEKRIRSLGYGAMAPWQEGSRRIRGNSRTWKHPLYVGYVFVSLPDPAGGWQHLCSEFNTLERRVVFRLLGGDAPAILRPDDVEYLQSIADGRFKPDEDAAPTFVVGDRVLVPDGHLQGLPSIIVKIKRGKLATLKVKGDKNDMYLERPIAILSRA